MVPPSSVEKDTVFCAAATPARSTAATRTQKVRTLSNLAPLSRRRLALHALNCTSEIIL